MLPPKKWMIISIISVLFMGLLGLSTQSAFAQGCGSCEHSGKISESVFGTTLLDNSQVIPEELSDPSPEESPETSPEESPETSPEVSPETSPETSPVVSSSPSVIQGTPTPFGKPLVVMDSYGGPRKPISAGKTFDVAISLSNHGYLQASNITLTFTSGDFVARETGGVQAIPILNPGESTTITQQLTATDAVSAKMVGTMTVSISYTDPDGKTYSNDSTIAFNVVTGSASSAGGTYPTATSTPSMRPQLVIKGYQIDVSPLQPGTTFSLALNISNVGSSTASNVTMVMGGGSGATSSNGTPQPGGVSGGSGEFTNFAPIESSNLQNLGNINSGSSANAVQKLIVNVSTTPGAYSVKFSFLYKDPNGADYQDDQVITLLVYRLPILDVNFYRTYDPFTVGVPGVLPIQIINLGRSSTVLGTMKVTAPSGTLSNDTMLVGSLDSGGYFPLDVNFTPDQPGTTEITVTIQYTDDFNQPREIVKKLSVEVADLPITDLTPETGLPGNPDGMEPPQSESLWSKVLRMVKGLFGLDSGAPQQVAPVGLPSETAPVHAPIPYPGGKG